VHVRGGKSLRAGTLIETAGGSVLALARDGELWRVALPQPPLEFFAQHGEVPLPPYITRAADAADRERYQSVLARVPGAVAAPTASLHFDAPLLARLDAAGMQRALVTLHVGAGTFQPIRSEDPLTHRMHAEFIDVPAATCSAIERTRAAGGRVVAIGTTVARALESAAADGTLRPYAGDTDIYIRPGHEWRVVDALVTNFHLPLSTLLVLVSAFAGRETVLAAYRHAVAQRYRFFSYGDAMFLTRAAAQA
jgi:S-adenosylmethionine:tRNA ribosyltransferase-isomerase